MNKRFLSIVAILSIGIISIFLSQCNFSNKTVNVDLTQIPHNNLSTYNFFEGKINDLLPQEGVLPYDLNTPLFSDYAYKSRFVWMPDGTSAAYDPKETLDFPLGAVLIKSFYYPEGFAKPEGERRIIETRLLINQEDGWNAYPYVWNDEQTDATLSIAGGFTEVNYTDEQGIAQQISYAIPNKIQCKSCHIYDEEIKPIGPKVRNINGDFDYEDGTTNQLDKWAEVGYLSGYDTNAEHPKQAVWNDESTGDLHDRAMAYLDINCGHCHNPEGPASTSGLNLYSYEESLTHLGVCKTPVAAGKGAGGFIHDIAPGIADSSIMIFRLESVDPGIMMPELGRTVAHTEGIALLKEWINAMEKQDCK